MQIFHILALLKREFVYFYNVKKILIILLFAPLLSTAQNALLYEVTHPKTGAKSYLFGTMHVQDEAAFAFNDSVYWAIDQCKKTAYELNLDQAEIQNSFSKEKMEELIDSAFVDRLTTYLADDFVPTLMKKMPADKFAEKLTNELLPAYFDLMKQATKGEKRSFFVDQYLQAYSEQQGKEIIGIETFQEQILAILGDMNEYQFDDKKMSKRIVNYMANNELKLNLVQLISGTEEMVSRYSNADLAGLCDYMTNEEKGGKMTTKIYERLLIDRNEIMFARTMEDVAKGGIFIAVGAGHLCGSNGLITQYEKEGYTIRPINTNVSYARELAWDAVKKDGFAIQIPNGVQLSNQPSNPLLGQLNKVEGYANTIFTNNGSASFSVQILEVVDDEEYDIIDIETVEDAAETYNAEDYIEMAGDAYDDANEEVLYETTYDDVERYEEVQELPEIEDTEIEEYPLEARKKSTIDPNSIKAKFSDKQKAYFKEVGDSLQNHFKGKMMTMMMGMMDLYQTNADTTTLLIDGISEEVSFSSSMMTGTQQQATVERNGKTYILTISGDAALLKSGELDYFFESFEAVE